MDDGWIFKYDGRRLAKGTPDVYRELDRNIKAKEQEKKIMWTQLNNVKALFHLIKEIRQWCDVQNNV